MMNRIMTVTMMATGGPAEVTGSGSMSTTKAS